MQDEDPKLDTREAAAFLGVKPATLEIWRSAKRYNLPYIKIGSRVFYRRSALVAFEQSRTVAA